MVLQVFANAGQVYQGRDAMLLQQRRGAHARELQQLRCGHCASAQDHGVLGTGVYLLLPVPHVYAAAALLAIGQGLEHQPRDLRRGPQLKVGTRIAGGSQKCFGGVPTPTAFLVHLEITHALIRAAVEVIAGGNAGLHRGLGKRVQDVPTQALFFNTPFATSVMVAQGLVVNALALHQQLAFGALGAVQSICALVMVFMQLEVGQAVFPAPTRVARDVCPVVVVAGLAAHVNHAVDAGATTQHLAAWVAQAAPVKAVSRFGLVHPIGARVANAIQITHGYVHPVVVVFSTRFDQQYPLGSVGTQAVGQQATRGARANDDVVESGVAHFEVGITNSAPLGVLSGQRCIMDFCLV